MRRLVGRRGLLRGGVTRVQQHQQRRVVHRGDRAGESAVGYLRRVVAGGERDLTLLRRSEQVRKTREHYSQPAYFGIMGRWILQRLR
jgi:ketosteroid isomerase-like protein